MMCDMTQLRKKLKQTAKEGWKSWLWLIYKFDLRN